MQRGMRPDPSIAMNSRNLVVEKEQKFLGVIFDSKLTFIEHIKEMKIKRFKTMNILKILSHQSWGADTHCLLSLFRSLRLSRIDYGCIIYQLGSKSALRILDLVYHSSIRLAMVPFELVLF